MKFCKLYWPKRFCWEPNDGVRIKIERDNGDDVEFFIFLTSDFKFYLK